MIQRTRLLFLLAILLLSACSLQSVAPEKTTYQFGANRPAQAAAETARFGILRVNDFRTPQLNRTASIIYRESDQRYVADPYRLFVAPPAILLAERSRNWLAASGLFRGTVSGDSRLDADATLEGELVELHVDVRNPKQPAAVLSLRAWLIDAAGKPLQPQWQYSQSVALDDASAAAAVAGFDRALAAALSDMETTLIRR